jgi:hypothetical protein
MQRAIRHTAHRLTCLIAAICLGQLPSTADSAQIYRCTDADGRQIFTDRGCHGQQAYAPPQSPSVTFTPIAESDQQRLRQARQREAQTRQAQQKKQARRHAQAMELRAKRQQLCVSATQALKELLAKRRRGYPLNTQRKLDTQEAALKSSKRENC